MGNDTAPAWTLEELGDLVARALRDDDDAPPSGRAREVPDGRTTRYDTTLGLVDRPGQYEQDAGGPQRTGNHTGPFRRFAQSGEPPSTFSGLASPYTA